MIKYNEDGTLVAKGKSIVNIKTKSKYLSDDLVVVDIDGVKYLKSRYSNNTPPKLFILENWKEVKHKDKSNITISDKHVVELDKLKITSETHSVNIMLITYIKSMTRNDTLITTNVGRLKTIIKKLIDSPETPLGWKYIEELLEYVSSNVDMFLAWLSGDKAKGILNKYITKY